MNRPALRITGRKSAGEGRRANPDIQQIYVLQHLRGKMGTPLGKYRPSPQ